jgi:allophanate hydrolase
MSVPQSLLIPDLLDGYRRGRFTPSEVMREVLNRMAGTPDQRVWISRVPEERVLALTRMVEQRSPESLPLYGIPFAIKDNIDLEGMPTTAACPDFSYVPEQSAPVVARLMAAGAIPVGKTNLDQFATGLVGTRSPYGACFNSVNREYISGGSSAGSAVAVALGQVSFSLGTDTAGSGRVPAAFNNIVGLKPSCGRLSTSGVVPACRSLDCVSIFALTAEDAAHACSVAEGYDATDPWSRAFATPVHLAPAPKSFRFGVPRAEQLEFFGDLEYARLFGEAVARLQALGGRAVEIDFEPFRATARLLYEGPWIAERYAAVGAFIESNPDAVHPVTRELIAASRMLTAADAFAGQHRLMELRRETEGVWREIDVLITPTTGTIYRIVEIEAEPILLNARLGFYTNFVNFLDLAAVAVPAGFRTDGLPFGVTLIARTGGEPHLLALADTFHRASVTQLGAHLGPLPAPPATTTNQGDSIAIAVCGAHMEGLPLNHQLTERGATLLKRTQTAPHYRLYALPGGPPQRPGLVRVETGGAAIEVEVWSVPASRFGTFVAGIPAPLGIGKVELADGQIVSGFLCESYALSQAADITHLGGWRTFIART